MKTEIKNKIIIPVINSINTNSVNEDIKVFGNPPDQTPHVKNTGIERNGGITNLNETETILPTGNNYLTENNKVITISPNGNTSNILIDNKSVGTISSYGVESNITLTGYTDVVSLGPQITPALANGGYMTLTFVNGVATVTLFNVNGVQQAQRSVTFTGLGTYVSSFITINFVRYNNQQYSDSFEFALRIGPKVVILKESNPGQVVTIGNFVTSAGLGAGNAINTTIVYGQFLIIAGANGRVASFDGTAWKNYDGTGTGTGPFNNGTAIMGNNAINASAVLGSFLVLGGVGGRVCYYDGSSQWINYNSPGSGTTSISNSGTATASNDIFSMAVYAGNLVVGSNGVMAYYNTTTALWVNYNASTNYSNYGPNGTTAIGGAIKNLYVDNSGNLIISGTAVTPFISSNSGGGVASFNSSRNYYPAPNNTISSTAAIALPGWSAIAYGNGKFVSVANATGTAQVVQYSTDAANWTATTGVVAGGTGWVGLTYGNGLFVAINGGSGPATNVVMTSPDGITWTSRTTPATTPNTGLTGVTFGNGKFVAVAGGSTSTTTSVMTSTDGINWSLQTCTAAGSAVGWTSVDFGNNQFIAFSATTGTTGICQTSPDGITWTARTVVSAPASGWKRMAYGAGLYVAVGVTNTQGQRSGLVMTSPDGITWTSRTSAITSINIAGTGPKSIIYADGMFVAIAAHPQSPANCVMVSTDGINWLLRPGAASPGAGAWTDICWGQAFGAGAFVSICATQLTTGAIWASYKSNLISSGYGDDSLTPNVTVIFSAGRTNTAQIESTTKLGSTYFFGGVSGQVGSYDGSRFYAYNGTGALAQTCNAFTTGAIRMTFGKGVFVGLGLGTGISGAIQVSGDGVTWVPRTCTASGVNGWADICYGNGLFVCVPGNTTTAIQTSIDANTWTARTGIAAINQWTSVTYGNGIFVAVAGNNTAAGCVMTSYDGITWTSRTGIAASAANGWQSVIYGNGVFVATGRGTSTTGVVMTSTDGITWTNQTSTAASSANGWNNVTFGNGLFVASCNNGTSTTGVIQTSPDGVTWTARTSQAGAGNGWRYATYGNGFFAMVGGNTGTTNAIQTSPDGITWTLRTSTAASATGQGWYGIAYGNGLFVAISNDVTTTGVIQKFNDFSSYNVVSNGTVVGSGTINEVNTFGSTVVFGGGSDKIGSYDGANFKNSDGTGTGTGIFNDGTLLGVSYNLTAATIYNGNYFCANSNGNTNLILPNNSSIGYNGYYLNGTTTQITDILAGQNEGNQVYTYRYESPNQNYYLILLVGNSLSLAYILDNSGTLFIYQLNAKYAIPQVSNGLSRHILTGNFTVPGTTGPNGVVNGNGNAISVVGYRDFSTFSTTPLYTPLADTVNAAGVLSQNALMGGIDVTYNDTAAPTAIQSSYYPNMVITPNTTFVNKLTPNTNTLINGYGKLTNNYGEALTLPYEIRVGAIAGIQSFLSAAPIDGLGFDNLGSLLTNTGEFDAGYIPSIIYNTTSSNMVYRYNGNFIFHRISLNPTNPIQKINSRLYKINTISPQNIIDSYFNSLNIGSSDYNGRMLFNGGAISSLATPVASVMYQKFSNGIDVGNKLPTSTLLGSNTIQIPGINLAYAYNLQNYGVDTYINNAYSFTTISGPSELIQPLIYNGGGLLVNSPLYTGSPSTTPNPVAIAQTYPSNNVITSGSYTYFLFPGFEGYLFGNQTTGNYQGFTINAQTYLFDGNAIYLADLNPTTNVLNALVFVCFATGLQLLTISPTTAYFLSSFDNGLFTFMGGRSVDKANRLVGLPTISQGVFNTKDNSLLLDATNNFIFLRDGIWSMTPKKANQLTTLKLYNTTNGIVIGNNSNNWQYTYNSTSTSTVVPLTFQSAYFGQDNNEKSILPNWIMTIYVASIPTSIIPINITLRGFDGSNFTVENKVINIAPKQFNTANYVRFRISSKNMKALASSIQVSCNSKILIQELIAEFVDDTNQTYSDMATV